MTAFVLSGGGSLGALQVGMLAALYERRISADLLVATSVGALNAAFVASRPQAPSTSSALARVWRAVRREDVFPVSLGALIGGLLGQRDHIVPDRALRRLVRRNIEFGDLAEAGTPLHVVAFDVIERREVLLSRGPALDAVCAAASVPGLFPPVSVGKHRLIDGGLVNNTPISHAVALGAERIFVLPTQRGRRRPGQPPRSALDAAMSSFSLTRDDRLEEEIARYQGEVDLIVLPAPNRLQVQPTDFSHSSRLIRDAHNAAQEQLAVSGPARLGTPVSEPAAA